MNTKYMYFICIFLTGFFFYGCGGGGGGGGSNGSEGSHLTVEWTYPGSLENIQGFKLYMDGNEICNTEKFPPFVMNCDISGKHIVPPVTITMTAYDKDFNESPHSFPYWVY